MHVPSVSAQTHFTSIWRSISEAIAPQVSPDTYQRWFAAVALVSADDEQLTLRVPNNIYQLWIETNYMPFVQAAIMAVLGTPRRLQFIFQEKAESDSAEVSEVASVVPLTAAGGAPVKTPEYRADIANSVPGAPEITTHGLNPRYTFDNFVVGDNCRYARAAGQAVAEAPARTYNPLFLYGGVGLGKTHLMQAIGQATLVKKKNFKVLYVSSERFTNEFIDAIQNSSLVRFRKRYRQADVLLIDDIQFLAGKDRSQEEFFHTFNALFDGHKQIVLSSDRPPSEIANLEHRLVSRFEWGLTAELQPPDIETRMAILRKKAENMQAKLAPEIYEFLARRIRTNVRRLEGALMRVASFASLSGRALTQETIENLLKDILQEEARKVITIDDIQRTVADHYDVRLADMTSKRRPANIAFPRQVAMYLARELTKNSLDAIGDAFGGRDHGTVLHAHRLVRKRMTDDEEVRQVVSMLDNRLQH
jgi:chromosomal replication initiator protein